MPDHLKVLRLRVEEEDLLLPFKVAAQIVERVGVFGLDDNGKVERQTLDNALALLGGGDDGLGIVHAVLLAESVEPVLRVERLEQLLGDEAVGDQPLEVVVVAAEETRVVVRTGDDEQLFIVRGTLPQHIQQRVGEDLLALERGNDAAVEQVRMARGNELLRAKQQRRDAIRLLKEPRRTVGVLVAAEDDGEKVLPLPLARERGGDGMRRVVLGEVFERQLHVARVGNENAAALHRRLLALAGEQKDARAAIVKNGAADARGTVLEHQMRAGDVLFDVGGDLRERLLAGVLLGDVDKIAVLPAQLAEILPALEGMGAGAAENGDHFPVGVFDLRRAVERVEAHAVVRIVDDDGDIFVAALVDLHTSRGARLAQSRTNIFLRHVERHADRHGGKRVGDIEKPRHGDGKFAAVLRRDDSEIKPVRALFRVLAIDGVRLVRAERDELAASLCIFNDAPGVLCVGIDAAEAAGIKDLELGGKVILKVRMLDGADVVAADIQKRTDVERDAAHAAVLERLRRGLHHKMRNAGLISVFKVLVELEHLGRGDVGLLGAFAVVVVDRGENGALGLVFRAQPVVEDIAHIVGRGALALRAGDADARELVRHMIVEELAEHDERIADVADEDAGGVCIVLPLGDIGDRAARKRIAEVFLFEMRALADEKRVCAERARVVGQAFDPTRHQPVRHGAAGQNAGIAQRADIFFQGVDGVHKRLLWVLLFRQDSLKYRKQIFSERGS